MLNDRSRGAQCYCTAALPRAQERWDFGSFYYRFPDGGESAADVYDRVSSFMESLYRHWKENEGEVENYVLVIHGVTANVFLMRFFQANTSFHIVPLTLLHSSTHIP